MIGEDDLRLFCVLIDVSVAIVMNIITKQNSAGNMYLSVFKRFFRPRAINHRLKPFEAIVCESGGIVKSLSIINYELESILIKFQNKFTMKIRARDARA